MKNGWTYKKLGEVVDNLRTGLNPRVHFRLNTTDAKGYYITVRELKGFSFTVDDRTDRINDYAIKRINERSNLKIGDVLYSGTGTIGRTALVQELPTWWNIKEGVYALTPKHDILDSSFLIYAMQSESFSNKVLSRTSGATVRSIPMKELKEIVISFPSLSEQKRIVERLDSAFENIDKLKANAEKQLAEARTLFQKSLAKAMEPKEGWEEKTLGQLGDLKNGMNFAHNEKGVDLHILGVGDFGNRFSIDDVRELQMISLNQQPSEDYLLKDGDIVFVRSNGNKQLVGRSLVVYPGDNSTTFSGFCIRFRKSLKVLDERFLVYLLKSDNTRKKLFGNGANISNLNQKTLQSLIVPLPSLAEQQRIVERLDALSENIRKYEEIQRQVISECDALKQALLRKVFE